MCLYPPWLESCEQFPSLKNLQIFLGCVGCVTCELAIEIWEALSMLMAYCVESCQPRWPSSRSCMDVAHAFLTAVHGREVASFIANMT